MQVIKIGGKAPAPVGVVAATEQAGPGLAKAEDGTYYMVVTFPGVAPVIVRLRMPSTRKSTVIPSDFRSMTNSCQPARRLGAPEPFKLNQ